MNLQLAPSFKRNSQVKRILKESAFRKSYCVMIVGEFRTLPNIIDGIKAITYFNQSSAMFGKVLNTPVRIAMSRY